MSEDNSEIYFFLIDKEGNRRVPTKIRTKHGPYGYALHPIGKGNDPKAARYTEDPKELVQAVVIERLGVRAKAKNGPQKGQQNTLCLGEDTVAGYFLSKSKFDWIEGAEFRPMNESLATSN